MFAIQQNPTPAFLEKALLASARGTLVTAAGPLTAVRSACLAALLSVTVSAQLAVLDAEPGAASSNPVELVAAQDMIYYSVRYSQTGSAHLFRHDGSTLARVPINGNNPSGPDFLVPYGRELFVAANDGVHGPEIVRVRPDGSSTTIDVRGGATGSFPQELALHGGALYFSANVPNQGGRNLWRYDPRSGALGPVWVGTAGVESAPTQLTSAGALLFFSGVIPGGARRLHVFDPATGATQMLPPTTKPELITAVGNRVFFRANSTGGDEPWVSDGTATGTFLLKNIHPSLGSNPADFAAFEGRCYFSAGAGAGGGGRELWSSDGTTAGTVMIDLNPGSGSSDPRALTPAGNTLFFVARRSAAEGDQLFAWPSGATAPVVLVVNPTGDAFGNGPEVGAVGADLILAGAKANSVIGREPYWAGPASVGLAANVAALGGSDPSGFVGTPTHAYFIADDHGAAGREVWQLPLSDSGLATWSAYGTACPGSHGVPALRCSAAPVLGGRFSFLGDGFVPSAPTVLVGGAGAATTSAACALLVRTPLLTSPLSARADGSVSIPIAVPNDSALLGAAATWQVLGLDAGGFAGIFNATNGVITIVGR